MYLYYDITQHIHTIYSIYSYVQKYFSSDRGAPYGPSPSFFWAQPHAIVVTFGLVQFCIGEGLYRWNDKVKPPYCWWHGSLRYWAGVSHIKVDDDPTLKSLTQGSTLPFHVPVVLQPHSSSVSSHGGCPVHYLLASMGWHPSLHQTHMILPTIPLKKMSTPIAHHLESSPIFSGHSGQCPWEKP